MTSIRYIFTKNRMFFIMLMFTIFINDSHTNQVIIKNEQLINSERIYDNQSLLLLEGGRFIIDEDGLLIIKNSHIDITVSQSNSFFVLAKAGKLILENSDIQVRTQSIPANSQQSAAYYLIRSKNGTLIINKNKFKSESIHTIGLMEAREELSLSSEIESTHYVISSNTIQNFHGGIYFIKTATGLIENNSFEFTSFGNIVILGSNNFTIRNNKILFPGRFSVGDGITLASSKNITIENNQISNGSCYGIQLIGCQDIKITNNTIVDGITYAVYISSTAQELQIDKKQQAQFIIDNPLIVNSNIVIDHNYLGQNRYAIAGDEVSYLNVQNNHIVQKFNRDDLRAFWTNNKYSPFQPRSATAVIK